MKSTRKILAHSAHRLDSVIYSDSTLPTVYRYNYAGRVATVLDESGRMDYRYGNAPNE